MLQSDEVAMLRYSIRSGAVGEEDIREFVAEVLNVFDPGVRYEEDIAVCAVAVALEDHYSLFAEEYLIDLASVRSRELSFASRIAAECLKHRRTVPVERGVIIVQGFAGLTVSEDSFELRANPAGAENVTYDLEEACA